MSVSSFSAALSGLNANQQKLTVIGNNLANINTVGYKASNVEFSDLVSQSVGGPSDNPMQIGLGAVVGSISPNFTQGGIESTGIATHGAIQGSGLFVIGDSANRAFTRAGNFTFDASGVLVTPDGQPVQGYTTINPATGFIDTTTQPTSIVIPPGVLRPPTATTLFSTRTNLNAGAPVAGTFAASAQIYDSLGQSHTVTINYTKTAANAWSYSMTVPGADVVAGVPGTPTVIGTGTLGFSNLGVLTNVNGGAAADVVITAPAWASGAAATNFSWDLVDASATPTLTGFAAPSATSSVSQNGLATASAPSQVTINGSGEIVASYGVGQSVTIAQFALATFNNPQGLVKLGTNLYSQSAASGTPSVGVAKEGGRGAIIGSALEQSNVDIAQEFTQMILAQRGYQANSRSITVADELLIETLNIKR